jgi:hypothetical protein
VHVSVLMLEISVYAVVVVDVVRNGIEIGIGRVV